ncbi:XI-F [Symbiodinium natans]|uniref:XI-F protein n=1 Tax=Symbiodinium natans TaxID=878477 RepID=A0A812PRE1_9DINO|nr:XI-F [Symbiodinium natans]
MAGSDLGALGLEVSSPVWVRVDGDEVWKGGVVKGLDDEGDLIVEVRGPGARPRWEEVVVSIEQQPPEFCKRNPELLKADRAAAVDDLSLLSLLNEPELLHAIESRFARDVIYTNTGPVLLAVNPFRSLPRLYDSHSLNHFLLTEDTDERLPPHVYRTSWQAYQFIKTTGAPQTILVSGESGSGKTETTKFVMRYLALAGSGGSEAALSVVERQAEASLYQQKTPWNFRKPQPHAP